MMLDGYGFGTHFPSLLNPAFISLLPDIETYFYNTGFYMKIPFEPISQKVFKSLTSIRKEKIQSDYKAVIDCIIIFLFDHDYDLNLNGIRLKNVQFKNPNISYITSSQNNNKPNTDLLLNALIDTNIIDTYNIEFRRNIKSNKKFIAIIIDVNINISDQLLTYQEILKNISGG